MLNEGGVVEMAVERGCEIVDPGTISIQDQITIMSQANTIVGPTGAALTNMIFAPPGLKFGCISERESGLNFNLSLSAMCEHKFSWLLGNFEETLLGSADFPQLPYTLDLETFARYLDDC